MVSDDTVWKYYQDISGWPSTRGKFRNDTTLTEPVAEEKAVVLAGQKIPIKSFPLSPGQTDQTYQKISTVCKASSGFCELDSFSPKASPEVLEGLVTEILSSQKPREEIVWTDVFKQLNPNLKSIDRLKQNEIVLVPAYLPAREWSMPLNTEAVYKSNITNELKNAVDAEVTLYLQAEGKTDLSSTEISESQLVIFQRPPPKSHIRIYCCGCSRKTLNSRKTTVRPR